MFKKGILALVVFSFLFSCKGKHTEYAIVSGLIANNEVNEIMINSRGFSKTIPVNLDGTFSDTIRVVNEGYHTFFDQKNKALLYLKNGDEININYDYSNMDKTISFSGIGAATSQYLVNKRKFDKEKKISRIRELFKLEKSEFDAKVSDLEKGLSNLLASNEIDSTLKAQELNKKERLIKFLKSNYRKEHQYTTALKKGNISPKFVNYENYKGGTTSLDDFKGKYVYIDVWATWCGPCKREIPFLKTLEVEYKNKNIAFVSISVDNGRGYKNDFNAAKEGWRKMIAEKNMSGIQLFADKAWQSDFIRSYGITGIPRFILIDPEGKIVNANAPRPSQSALKNVLKSLGL